MIMSLYILVFIYIQWHGSLSTTTGFNMSYKRQSSGTER